jgi:hypothetical protein
MKMNRESFGRKYSNLINSMERGDSHRGEGQVAEQKWTFSFYSL